MPPTDDLEIRAFSTRADLHAWLEVSAATHTGLWVRLVRAGSGRPSVTFQDLLEEGLCFGWRAG
ncbi:MAG TPA: hypothetical protein VFR40_03005 [Lapillicoccus sp.]|nr:hypothetical protein [Lapillicoccus sp.]